MQYPWYAYSLLMLLSGTSCALCGLYILRRRGAVGRAGLAAVFFCAAIWGLAYGLELRAVDEDRALWGALKYVGIVLLPLFWLVFALQYTGRERVLSRRVLGLLLVEPALTLAILALPATRHLVRSYPLDSTTAFVHVELGPAFYALFGYSAVLAALGTGLLTLTLVRISPAYRRQSLVLVSAIAIVWIANTLATAGVGLFETIDPTPVALAVAGYMLMWEVFRFGLLDLVPVARTTLLETMPDPVLVLDAHHRVIDHNPAAQRILGAAESPLLGLRLRQVVGVDLPDAGRDHPTQHELTIGGPDGERSFELVMSVLGSPRSDGVGHLVVLRDITERKRVEAELQQLAHFDVATGLPNRALFADRFDQALARARRRGGSLAVLFVDLDHFKLVNDTLGHDGGDEALVTAADRLRGLMRSEDTLARFGGDEFSVLLPEVESPAGPLTVAAKILAALSEPVVVRGRELDLHASIGVALYPADGADRVSLLKCADAAMYEAKARGGNQARLATPEVSGR